MTGDTGFFLSLETKASLLFSPGNSRMLFLYLLPHPSITKSALFKNSIFREIYKHACENGIDKHIKETLNAVLK